MPNPLVRRIHTDKGIFGDGEAGTGRVLSLGAFCRRINSNSNSASRTLVRSAANDRFPP